MKRPDNTLLPSVERFLDQHEVRSGRVLVGVSGGPDSVALLLLLRACSEARDIELVVAHLDHRLRPDSESDAEWVTRLADSVGCRVLVERAEPLDPTNQGIEAAARATRYAAFERIATATDCQWVAVGHTADDQVETVLHHLLRGSGLAGIAGIPASRSLASGLQLIRPLSNIRRVELQEWLTAEGHAFLTDPTNMSEEFTRNRIRHQLLPLLREAFNPQVDEAILRLANQSRDTQSALRIIAEQQLEAVLLDRQPNLVKLQVEPLQSSPDAVIRELFVVLWMNQNWPRQQLSFAHLQSLLDLVRVSTSSSVSLPGRITGRRRGSLLELVRDES